MLSKQPEATRRWSCAAATLKVPLQCCAYSKNVSSGKVKTYFWLKFPADLVVGRLGPSAIGAVSRELAMTENSCSVKSSSNKVAASQKGLTRTCLNIHCSIGPGGKQ